MFIFKSYLLISRILCDNRHITYDSLCFPGAPTMVLVVNNWCHYKLAISIGFATKTLPLGNYYAFNKLLVLDLVYCNRCDRLSANIKYTQSFLKTSFSVFNFLTLNIFVVTLLVLITTKSFFLYNLKH